MYSLGAVVWMDVAPFSKHHKRSKLLAHAVTHVRVTRRLVTGDKEEEMRDRGEKPLLKVKVKAVVGEGPLSGRHWALGTLLPPTLFPGRSFQPPPGRTAHSG